jgi:hypothetical protein
MGADEFSGLSDDQSAPAISYTILSNNSCTTGRTITATIIDGTGLILLQQNHVFIIRNRPMPLAYWLEVRIKIPTSPFIFTMDYSLIGGVTTGCSYNSVRIEYSGS